MTTYMSDDGTGKSDGTAWDAANWTTEGTSTGGSATYESSALRIQSGAAGGYSGAARMTKSVNMTAVADVDISGTFVIDANEPYGLVCLRATTSTIDFNNAYYLDVNKGGSVHIGKVVSYSGSNLATQSKTLVAGTTYGFRFQAVGTALKARTWTGSEPGTWDLEVTDSTFTSAGKAGISIGAGGAAVNHRITFDGIIVTNGATNTAVTLTETGSGADTLAVTAAVQLSDTGTGDDTLTATHALAETGSGTDALTLTATRPITETGTGTDALTVVQEHSLTETGTGTDDLAIIKDYAFTETGGLTDALSVEVFQLRHDLLTEVEFTPGTWTDVTSYVVAEAESTGTFGRPTRYDDVGSATWSTTLRNDTGAFTPGNVGTTLPAPFRKGFGFRTSVTYAGQTYPRFWGKITGIVMPAVTDISNCVVQVQATDILAELGRKTLLSPFVEESRRQATINNGGCDVFPFVPSQVATETSIPVAATSFENRGLLFPGSTRLGSMYAMPVANGCGTVKSSAQDSATDSSQSAGGALVEGQLTFETGDNGSGRQAHPVLVCKPQAGFQQCEMFFKIPKDALPPVYATGTHNVTSGQNWNTIKSNYGMTTTACQVLNPDAYPAALAVGQVLNIQANTNASEWVLAQLWVGSTELFRIVLGNYNDTVVIAAKKPDNSAQFIYTSANLADERWRKLTVYRTGTNTVRFNINDSPNGPEQTFAADLMGVDTVYLGGRATPGQVGQQVQCPPVSLSGVAFQATQDGVWYWYCLGAPPANLNAQERYLELAAYAAPVPLVLDGAEDHATKVVRTSTTGRTVLDCMQELARTIAGYLWVDPATGKLLLVEPESTTTPIATITLDADDNGGSPPQWRDTIDAHPTRATAACPAGSATSVNANSEASGAYKEATVTTCAATVAGALAVADRVVSTGASLNLTNLSVDLLDAATPLWGTLLAGLAPGALLRVAGIPVVLFGYDTADVGIESWTESYTVESAVLSFETTPIRELTSGGGNLHSWTVTSANGTQVGTAVTTQKPAGTATGDLLLAVMTCDATGSVATMAAPDSGWTAQGAGGTGDSGFGQVWTKTAGASEPTSYAFTVGGTTGSSVLVSDNFTGSNNAALNAAKWTAGETRTGASRTIQSNSACLDPGSITGYGGRVSMKAAIADKADVDVLCSVKIANGDTFPQVILRGDSGVLGQSGYAFRPGVGGSDSTLSKVAGYAATTLGTIAGSLTANTWYKIRFQAIGTALKVRIWLATASEPGSWGINVTDSTITAAGTVGFANGGGGSTGSLAYFDDVTVSDPHAVTAIPEAKTTLMRIVGADTADPVLVAPSWSDTPAATTSHIAPSLTIPTGGGLLVDSWHLLTTGGGSGGGEGGSEGAFSFGMAGFSLTSTPTAANAWLPSHNLAAVGHWSDSDAAVQQEQYGTGPGETFGTWTGIIDIAFGGVFGAETWAQAAAGTFDSRWTTGLNALKTKWGSRTPGNLHLRFAHEFNGDFSPWAVSDSGDMSYTNFKNAWIRWANLVHSILPGVQIVWSPNYGTSSLTHVDDAYPGSAYVDVIGPDLYNSWPHITDAAGWTANKFNNSDSNGNPVGFEAWRLYAATKLKPVAFPEWGNPRVDTGGGAGGGDDPYFAQTVLAWMKANGGHGAGQVKYAVYFSIGPSGGYTADYEVWPTARQPLTAAAVQSGA
jgi:hypothetical protein